jgi:6-pyruvoyltetrahydropterin/6-carboxytetrahydropterin synthase
MQPKWILGKEFSFEASHFLPNHDGKCARLHGHSWKGIIYVQGDALQTAGPKQGMVMDYSEIKAALNPLINQFLDHWHLNDTLEMENPTSEAIAEWLFERLSESGLRGLLAVQINETCTSRCLYTRSGGNTSILGNAFIVGS